MPLAINHPFSLSTAAICLVACLLLQIGCNFINDAADGDRGTDEDRLGPQRAVAAGLISSRAMWRGGCIIPTLAFVTGLYLSWLGGWPIFALGIFSLVGAVAYTAGPAPLAYHGLGDVFVLIYFGIIAVLGSAFLQLTTPFASPLDLASLTAMYADYGLADGLGQDYDKNYVQSDDQSYVKSFDDGSFVLSSHMAWQVIPMWWWSCAAALGLQATAIIAVNNHRDQVGDAGTANERLRYGWGIMGIAYILSDQCLSGTLLGLGGMASLNFGPQSLSLPWAVLFYHVLFGAYLALLLTLAGKAAAVELVSGIAAIVGIILS